MSYSARINTRTPIMVQPAEAALGIVRVDLCRHGDGSAEGFSVEPAENFVLQSVHVCSRKRNTLPKVALGGLQARGG